MTATNTANSGANPHHQGICPVEEEPVRVESIDQRMEMNKLAVV